jgi:NAD(P)-dependent dehydrogenase (short-subunit alcohol dehydrogenase family)
VTTVVITGANRGLGLALAQHCVAQGATVIAGPGRRVGGRVLERAAEDLGGSSIVCLDGLSKSPRTAAHPRDYRRVKRYGAEFQKRRTVLE